MRSSAVFIFSNLLKTKVLNDRLVGQSLSALSAASLQNGSSVRSLHSLSEAVLLFSLTLFRLVSSEHLLHLLKVLIGSVLHGSSISNRNVNCHFYAFTQ